tara:strand:+ start:344 stop:577 length:234 start_codon:yes stop_codon:yes gene_type:complete
MVSWAVLSVLVLHQRRAFTALNGSQVAVTVSNVLDFGRLIRAVLCQLYLFSQLGYQLVSAVKVWITVDWVLVVDEFE